MTALGRLDDRLKRIERRLRLLISVRGLAVSAGFSLFLTVLLVWISNRYRFASEVVLPVRVLLFACVAAAVTFALAIPISRFNRRRLTTSVESRFEDLDGRLLTAVERADPTNPFTDLVAEDALRVLDEHGTEQLAPTSAVLAASAAAIGALAVLIWIIAAGPGYWGYGASLLWTGHAKAGSRPLYDIAVQPGNKTVRRRSDQPISAHLLGFSSEPVLLHARYAGANKWETLAMRPQPEGNGYQVIFPGLADSLEYYVQASDVRSKRFTISVKDVPAVKRIRVELHYPAALGLKDSIQDPGGDIRAIQGSRARISVLTDKPLSKGLLVLEDGSKAQLQPQSDGWMTANLAVSKDGSYHVAALDSGESIRISDDYFIEAKKDEAPSVRILRPGRDPHVSPIEEVPVAVEANDDFGVRNIQLHYSVNGGPEEVKTLAQNTNAKDVQGKTTLYFEDFKLVPGDLVSFYATAQDATHTARTDIVFAQAEPFDFKFRQSQQSGGMGGGGQEETNISERQKEIIAATWNELKDSGKDQATLAENARFLSGLEGKLGDQAKALAERMGNRELDAASPQFEQFSKEMVEASSQMSQAVDRLKPGKWSDALQPEQKALQSLLRAESLFREIQVAYGQRGGGGMGSGGEQRELARLLDLELDNSKNQYETGQQAQLPGNQQQQEQIDKALERLKELARRQQELAQQPHSSDQQFQQRWEEEQLRREAEQLRQQMEQLSRNSESQNGQRQKGGQSSSGSQSGSQQASASSQGGNAGRSSSSASQISQNQRAIEQAMKSLQRAEEDMRNAVSNRDAAARTRAAGQLAEAQEALRKMTQGAAASNLSELAQRAHQLAQNQKDLANRIKQLYGANGINLSPPAAQSGAQASASPEMPEMDGPDYAGGWYRRRLFRESGGPVSESEKRAANRGEQLSREMQQLQSRLQQQAQSMQGEQPDAARDVRKALSDAEQQELALRMQKSADWMRQGFGSEAWPMQDSITQGLDQLSRQLDHANAQASNEPASGSNQDQKVLDALARVRSLREQMERELHRGEPQQGPRADSSSSSQTGSGQPGIQTGEGAREAIDELNSLRSGWARNDRQLRDSLSNAIGSLNQIRSQAGRLDSVIGQDAVTSLERLELELAQRVTAIETGARTGAPENAPAEYREALAEYYRRLSKP